MMPFIQNSASCEIGTGYVMRCIAIGQAWEEKDEGETK